jgi:ElaB/YqjD/DUF883 family membrane-anchored ribosome-binding protein
MTPESRRTTPDETEQKSPAEIQAEIDATREELGDTVAAVADKADIKKQAKAKLSETKESVGAKTDQAKSKVAETTGSLSDRAQEATPESAAAGAQQAQQFAKENPVPLAIAGAFLAGFALARLLSR